LLLIRVSREANVRLRGRALVLVISLLAVLPQGMLQGYTEYSYLGWISRSLNPQAYSQFVTEVNLVSILMNPVLLFVLMYVYGFAIDLRKDYVAVAALLFIGAFLGGFVGRSAIYYASPASKDTLSTLGSAAFESIASAVSAVFVGFSAVALAFVRKPQGIESGGATLHQG